jgi:hypothetical protein
VWYLLLPWFWLLLQLGETLEGLPPLERLLRCASEACHAAIADTLWESSSDAEAVQQLLRLAQQDLPAWEAEVAVGDKGSTSDDEANTKG